MFRFFDRADNSTPSIRRTPQDSKRLWLLLGSSSFLMHLGLIYWVGVVSLRFSEFTSGLDGTPIDLIELPSTDLSQPSSTQPTADSSRPASNPEREAQVQVQTAPTQLAPELEDMPSSTRSIDSGTASISSLPTQSQIDQTIANQQAAEDSAKTEDSAGNVAVEQESTEGSASPIEPAIDSAMSSAAESAAIVPDSPGISPSSSSAEASPEASPQSLPTEGQTPASNHPAHIERIATATPTPVLSTQPIDVPIPDVSGRLPDPADSASHLAANVTQQIMIPSQLTASLTATSLPPHRDQVLDETAQPTTEVQTFASNSTSSPCRVTPEIVRYLGKTVAMQVITNEKGRVVHTITQESSQSLAYDELATCLVKNWTFEPAIARGQPVANDGLVVHIKIDRS